MNEEPTIEKTISPLSTFVSMPLVKAGAAIVVIFVLGWKANSFFGDVEESLRLLTKEVSSMRHDLMEEIGRKTSDKWTRTEQKLWTFELNVANGGRISVPPIHPNQP